MHYTKINLGYIFSLVYIKFLFISPSLETCITEQFIRVVKMFVSGNFINDSFYLPVFLFKKMFIVVTLAIKENCKENYLIIEIEVSEQLW